MWFKVEQKRSSVGQKYVVRCNSEIAGSPVVEERSAKGATEARKTAEILASSLNVTATVYGTDADGEFVHGVYEISEGAAVASSPLIKRLFAESAAASLTFKDQDPETHNLLTSSIHEGQFGSLVTILPRGTKPLAKR